MGLFVAFALGAASISQNDPLDTNAVTTTTGNATATASVDVDPAGGTGIPTPNYLGIALNMAYGDVRRTLLMGMQPDRPVVLRLDEASTYGYFDEPRQYVLRASSPPYIRAALFQFREDLTAGTDAEPVLFAMTFRFNHELMDFLTLQTLIESRYFNTGAETVISPQKTTWAWPIDPATPAGGEFQVVLTRNPPGSSVGHSLQMFRTDEVGDQSAYQQLFNRVFESDVYRQELLDQLAVPDSTGGGTPAEGP